MNILKELKLSRKENKQLKKLLANNGIISTCENCEEFGICPHSYREYDYKCELDKVTIKQKEFIEYLEKIKKKKNEICKVARVKKKLKKSIELIGVVR